MPTKPRLRKRLADLVDSLEYEAAAIDGMAYIDPATNHSLRVFLSCAKASPDGDALRNFRLVAELPDDGGEARLQAPIERISHVKAQAFTLDPASCPPPQEAEARRATREPIELDPLRVATASDSGASQPQDRHAGSSSRCGKRAWARSRATPTRCSSSNPRTCRCAATTWPRPMPTCAAMS